MVGAVLAGGLSRRMGTPKAFIEIGGIPLIRRVLDVLSPAVDRVVIVSPDEAPFAGFGVPVVADEYPRSGPLGGIHAALRSYPGEACLAVACDQPFLSPALLALIAASVGGRDSSGKYADGLDASIPFALGRPQPLTAAYLPTCLPAAEARLKGGSFRMTDFLGDIDIRVISEDECRSADPGLRSFINLNSPEDLARICGA